ncbi:MAG TPA: helix-turn-helix domain-containing protein [Egibacteraceae bacterium]|nr:helix-turn-helix domain-containing protein [Egibacteraceae bacterium]
MRVTTAFNTLLALPGVNVTAVEFGCGRVLVDVALRRRRLVCAHCGYTTRWRHNTQARPSTWRALDLGVWQVVVRARLRRLSCPADGVVVEEVPFARHGARMTRDVDDLVAWLATKMDKTAITRLTRINWRTVGAIVERVVADELDPHRLDGLFEIGIDEVSS